MRFVSIINRLLQFKTTKAERDQLRQDIVTWYTEYEKYVRAYLFYTCDTNLHC